MDRKDMYCFARISMLIMLAVLLMSACSSPAAAEDITYTYRTLADELLATGTVSVPDTVNVQLPDTTWKLDMVNSDGRFSLDIAELNSSEAPQLDIKARLVNLSEQTYDGELKHDSGAYQAKYAYAFNISQLPSKDYTVSMDYSSLSGVTDPVIFKCNFNFTSNTTETSTCALLSTSDTGSVASATTSGFSSFFLAQHVTGGGDHAPGGGGGGGGGGGLGSPETIYVKPTPEGESVPVIRGDELIIEFEGEEYHFRVVSVGHHKVELKSLASYISYDIELGDKKRIGLKSFFSRDITVSMYVSNRFAVLTFKTIQPSKFSFPLLPPSSEEPSPAPEEAGVEERPERVYTPRPAPAPAPAGPEAAGDELQELEVPESPINIWTIIIALALVIFLVGGVALYRARLHRMGKPPTVTRTGLEPSGLPETSSEGSGPAPKIKPGAEKPAVAGKEAEVSEDKAEGGEAGSGKKAVGEVVPEKREALSGSERVSEESGDSGTPGQPVHISKAKKLELEKYIFHAFSLGFKEPRVRSALISKGWPKQVVDEVLREIRSKK